eukprot:CAMPEP_0113906332 /NCGR_PEP_ID=MMETSP0780_2-20120614/24669_1 /TAXON_ID=652834 /ORGANISM="Palpitomonas bilix" /LENGTH=66 /DNA_ID=CAMNT_0000900881 /DNA_START=117 /DNA_END=314 /DNA_ORIENTATION=+ /assembly_acc=CAM_ASM_000599
MEVIGVAPNTSPLFALSSARVGPPPSKSEGGMKRSLSLSTCVEAFCMMPTSDEDTAMAAPSMRVST